MNDLAMARRGYTSSSISSSNPIEAEYSLIARLSHRLAEASRNRERRHPEFVAALSENRRFWNLVAVSVADAGNGMSADLKARLFWISEFVAHETGRILSGESDPEILIEINASIMQGLRMAATPR